MNHLSSDAQRLIAQTRELDDPTLADRDRIRSRLDASWAPSPDVPRIASRVNVKLWLTTSVIVVAGLSVWPLRSPEQAPHVDSAPPPQPSAAAPSGHAEPAPTASAAQHAPSPAASSAMQPSVAAAEKKRTERQRPAGRQAKQQPAAASQPPESPREASPAQRDVAEPSQAQPSAPSVETKAQVRAVDERDAPFASAAIGDEVSLLGAAENALRSGQPTRALGYIRQHSFRFPSGALAQERDAVHALALCALQRKTAARQVFEDLQRRAPSAAVLTRIRSDCGF